MSGKLYRSSENKKLCGVCGGIGEHFGIDANIIRIIWIIVTILSFPLGIILYIACVFLLPKDEEKEESSSDFEENINYNDEDDEDFEDYEEDDDDDDYDETE